MNQNETDLIAGVIATAILRSVTPTLRKARTVAIAHDPDPVSPAGAVSATGQRDDAGFAVARLGSPGATPEKGHWVTIHGHATYIDDDGKFHFHGKNGPATDPKAPGSHAAAYSWVKGRRDLGSGGATAQHAIRSRTPRQIFALDKQDHLHARDLAQYAAHHVATIAGRTAGRQSTSRWQEDYAVANPHAAVIMNMPAPVRSPRPTSQPPVPVARPEHQIPEAALANADRILKAVLAADTVSTQRRQVLDVANHEAQRALASYERQQRANDRDPSQPAPDARAVRDALAKQNRSANACAHARDVHRAALHALILEPGSGVGITVSRPPPASVREAVNQGVAFINRLVGPGASWLPQASAREVSFKTMARGGRAHYNGGGVVTLARGDYSHAVVHELGHYLEECLAGVQAQRATWFAKRVEGQVPTRLTDHNGRAASSHGQPEWGFVDSFREHYVGKVYKDLYSEVIAMGCEYLHDDPVAFAKADPDHFRFIIAALKGTP